MASSYRSTTHLAALALLVFGALSLSAWSAFADEAADKDEAGVGDRLAGFYEALTNEDISRIENFVVTGEHFTMFEGKLANWGWTDYRDNHLSGELDDLAKVEINVEIKNMEIDGDLAFVSYLFAISPKGNPDQNYGSGRATAVLVRQHGNWLILHLHTS